MQMNMKMPVCWFVLNQLIKIIQAMKGYVHLQTHMPAKEIKSSQMSVEGGRLTFPSFVKRGYWMEALKGYSLRSHRDQTLDLRVVPN